MAVAADVTDLLEIFENGSANPLSRLKRAVDELRRLGAQRGWADHLPQLSVDINSGIDQAGADIIPSLPSEKVLVHLRYGCFGNSPGYEELLVLLLGGSGDLLDEFMCRIGTGTRMINRRPWFQPAVEEDSPGNASVVVQVGLLSPPWFSLSHRGRVVSAQPEGPNWQQWAELRQRDGLCRFLIETNGFRLVWPELQNNPCEGIG